MRKIFLTALAVIVAALSVNAQVQVQLPHPDLGIKLTRCAYGNGILVVDMLLTNYGSDENVIIYGSQYGTIAYDDDGNLYSSKTSKILVGNANQELSASTYEMLMPKDIPVKVRVQLEGVNSSATKLSILKLIIASTGSMGLKNKTSIDIKNLEWAK